MKKKLLVLTQVVDKNHPILGFFHGWLEEFASYFESIEVVCLEEGTHELPDNVHVYSLGKEKGINRFKYLWRFYVYFFRIFFFTKVDYVLFHMGAIYNVLGAPFFLLRRFLHTDFLWWKTHGHINLLGRLALLFVDRVYTASAESFPINTKKRQVVGHAIDLELFTPNQVVNREPLILSAGRLVRTKRVEVVIEVVRALKLQGRLVDARIVGPEIDSNYVTELKTIVKNYNLEDRVTFLPAMTQDKLRAEYERAEIFINPSNTNSIDKVVLEAMAMGAIPLTDNLAFSAILSPFMLFAEKGDIAGLTSQVLRILDLSPQAKNELRDKLRAIVVNEHSLKTLSQRIFSNVYG